MGTAITYLIAKGLPEKWARVILIAGLFVAVLAAGLALKLAYDHHVIKVNNQKVEKRAAPATDQAATERATETVAIAQHEQEMHHEIAAQPDQPIAPTSHTRACEQLRRAGRNPPACR